MPSDGEEACPEYGSTVPKMHRLARLQHQMEPLGGTACSLARCDASGEQIRLLRQLSDTVPLNSKEETRWKAQPQNGNLCREVAVVWSPPKKSICALNWSNAANAFTRPCIRPPLILLYRNC